MVAVQMTRRTDYGGEGHAAGERDQRDGGGGEVECVAEHALQAPAGRARGAGVSWRGGGRHPCRLSGVYSPSGGEADSVIESQELRFLALLMLRMPRPLTRPSYTRLASLDSTHVRGHSALTRALAADTIAVLELRTDPEAISTRATLTQIREQALAMKKR